MAGIRIIERDGRSVLHSTVWTDPEEVPVVFILVKEGATALAHPDYIADVLYSIDRGDLTIGEAWDVLLVKTPQDSHPEVCRVRLLTGTGGGAEILVGKHVVHRIKGTP